MPEISVDLFGIVRRLSMRIELMAGNLDVYEFLEPAHDEIIIASFGLMEQKLEIAFDQFFAGCAEPSQLTKGPFGSIGWHRRVIGFVRCDGALWTHSRLNGRFEADAPGVSHKVRDRGDLILAPAFQPGKVLPVPVFFRSKTNIFF